MNFSVLDLTKQQTFVNSSALRRLFSGCALGVSASRSTTSARDLRISIYSKICIRNFSRLPARLSRARNDPFKQIFVQSTAEMAARAGTATMMEAAETAEDAEVLHRLGSDYAQGYFFLMTLPFSIQMP
jgi:hypothetical protein